MSFSVFVHRRHFRPRDIDTLFRMIGSSLHHNERRRLFYPAASQNANQRRGVKTRTVISASSLSQPTQPPLSPITIETVPTRLSVVQEHLKNVRHYKDCIVLTRVGDFYELYGDQVDQYAPLVNLKKARKSSDNGDVAMAGFQYTQLDRYLKMFVQDYGKQVAISEQFLIPDRDRTGTASGPQYYRKVVRVVTPGTLIDETFVNPFENNYLLAIHFEDLNLSSPATSSQRIKRPTPTNLMTEPDVGLSWVDLSSGEFFTQTCRFSALPSLIARVGPREVVLDADLEGSARSHLRKPIEELGLVIRFHQLRKAAEMPDSEWSSMLGRAQSAVEQAEYTLAETSAANLVLDYVHDKLLDLSVSLQPPVRRIEAECMMIDKQSLRNLEIRATLRDGNFRGTLLHSIRETVTRSGARLLNQRLVAPSMSIAVINERLDLVEELLNHDALREDVIALLKRTYDTYRLMSKFSIGKGSADDLLDLAKTVDLSQQIVDLLHGHISSQQDHASNLREDAVTSNDMSHLRSVVGKMDLEIPVEIANAIRAAIDEEGLNQRHLAERAAEAGDEPSEESPEKLAMPEETPSKPSRRKKLPQTATITPQAKPEEIWIMRRHASSNLQNLHERIDELFFEKERLTTSLRTELKAESLTLRWSSQLQHFCHVKGRDAQGNLAKLDGARVVAASKSTRSFFYPAWTDLGRRIDDAKRQIRLEEQAIFELLRSRVLANLSRMRQNAGVLDELDVACSSAVVAKNLNLVRPVLNDGVSHKIIGGRHPTVDSGLREQGRHFTSNDCTVGDGEKIYLITGPNMAGKSTYLRQNALITVLAQTGCFVPAKSAEIGLVDKIFSRVGSADNLYQDQSTFMVEMLETAEILKQATPRSFVIMDEVGRGTTPEDGVAVGFACLHHLQYTNECRTLFATHFHPLADMTTQFPDVACYCTDVAEEADGSWSYMHKLRQGVNRSSHALKVARLAGMPESAIQVAADVLVDLQQQHRSVDLPEKEADSIEGTSRSAAVGA